MKPRRTQEERSAATVRRLLDAATEALIDVGYAEASIQEICRRAELSQGALFRQFPTREALLVAVGDDVAHRTLSHYRIEFEQLRGKEEPYVLALRLVRSHCRSRLNQAWYELAMAARTRPTLQATLRPALERYHTDIVQLAAELLPEVATAIGSQFPVLVDLIVSMFDGESIEQHIGARPGADDARLELLANLARLMLGGAAPGK